MGEIELMALTPGITSISNFRELGGLPTTDGRVVRGGVAFRSAQLALASDTDLERIVELGISTIVDLRTPADKRLDGENRIPDGVQYIIAPMGDLSDAEASPGTLDPVRAAMLSRDPQVIAERFGDGQAAAMIRDGQRSFVDSEQAATAGRAYREALLDSNSGGALVHCSAGKDRTVGSAPWHSSRSASTAPRSSSLAGAVGLRLRRHLIRSSWGSTRQAAGQRLPRRSSRRTASRPPRRPRAPG